MSLQGRPRPLASRQNWRSPPPSALGWRQGSKRWSDERPQKTASPRLPAGPLVLSLRTKDFDGSRYADSATIQDSRLISSYNWMDREKASILVPGKPPLWTPPPGPAKPPPDSGEYVRDKNAARCPQHPLEAAIVASLAVDPSLPADVDVAACGSTLGNLLRFVRGSDRPFRMLVEKVGHTVCLVRRENSPTELIPDVWGYGHTFPDMYTTWEPSVRGSASHQRIVRYSFGGLVFLVRSEGDGYLGDGEKKKTETPQDADAELDALLGTLSETKVAAAQPSPLAAVKVTAGGEVVAQDRVFDLKTRSLKTKDKDHLAEELPRLWVSRVPNFVLALHDRGLFEPDEIHVQDVRADVDRWERDHGADLARLAALVHRVVELVSAEPSGKLELCHEVPGRLDVRKQLRDAGDAMSAETRARWEEEVEGPLVLDWDDVEDFTACSEACGYCGGCLA